MIHQRLLSDQVTQGEVDIIMHELEAVLRKPVDGDVVEFGCYVGTTSVFLAKVLAATTRQLYLYDSFAGLPEKTKQDSSPAGEQFKAGELHATKKELVKNLKQAHVPLPTIKKAWFNEVVDADIPAHIAFAFLDGDYYESVKDPLQLIWSHLSPGAVVVVDDYANEALPGAAAAVDEWLRTHPAKLRVQNSLAILSDIS